MTPPSLPLVKQISATERALILVDLARKSGPVKKWRTLYDSVNYEEDNLVSKAFEKMGTAEDGRSEDGFDRPRSFFIYIHRIADSTKAALDIVNCTVGIYCLVVSQVQPLLNEVYIKTEVSTLSLILLRHFSNNTNCI